MTDLLARLQEALQGRYTIEREIGAGGMATVYLAEDVRHQRRVALKVLRPELAMSIGAERFLREIRIAAGLMHPHILPLHDSGVSGDALWYVMPYVDGPSLRDRLNREGELPVADAVRILREVADALAQAHKQGIVHRDIKPENVMISGRHALVTDFGVAKAVTDANATGSSATSFGVAIGTPAYMAPEQAAADPNTDHRADIYAWGVMAYELLAGQLPFSGNSPQELLAAHFTLQPVPIAERRDTLPAPLASLVMRALAKKPADRPQSADELVSALEAVATPGGGTTPPETRTLAQKPIAATTSRTPPSRTMFSGVAIGVVVLLALAALWYSRRPSTESSPAAVVATVKRVGVLPFESRSRDSADAYLADGMATDLTTALAASGRLHVLSRSSAFALRGKTAKDAGAALEADAMVEGTVGKVDGRIRVTASLVNVADEAVLWSHKYDVVEKDLYDLHDSIATEIASALGAGQGSNATRIAARRTANPEAHALVLRGQFVMEKQTESGLREAIKLFENAARLDSSYADPWNGLAEAWYFLADSYVPPNEAIPPMRAAVDKALVLDPSSAWAHALKGVLLSTYMREYSAAEREYVTALSLDSTIQLGADYGMLLRAQGNKDSAYAVVNRARRHNPFTAEPVNVLLQFYHSDHRPDSVLVMCDVLQRIVGPSCVYYAMLKSNRAKEAVELARSKLDRSDARSVLTYADILAQSGDSANARRELATILGKRGGPYLREDAIAAVYIAIGDKTAAFDWLNRALDARAANMAYVNRHWRFEALHGDPRFNEIVRKAGLSP